jgi:hypothetical protein
MLPSRARSSQASANSRRVVGRAATSTPRRRSTRASSRHRSAAASVGKVFWIRLRSRALQTKALKPGVQSHGSPLRDPQVCACLTSIPVWRRSGCFFLAGISTLPRIIQ